MHSEDSDAFTMHAKPIIPKPTHNLVRGFKKVQQFQYITSITFNNQRRKAKKLKFSFRISEEAVNRRHDLRRLVANILPQKVF